MLCSTICALLLSSAAGATVRDENSAQEAQAAEEHLDDGGAAHGKSFETFDVASLTAETSVATASRPQPPAYNRPPAYGLRLGPDDPDCDDPRISCHIKDLVLLKPGYVLAVRRPELSSLVGTKLVAFKMDGIFMARLKYNLSNLPAGLDIQFRDYTQLTDEDKMRKPIVDPASTFRARNIGIGENTARVYFLAYESSNNFVSLWNIVKDRLGADMNDATFDKIMSGALLRYKELPKFMRHVAKLKYENKKELLEAMIEMSNKVGEPMFPLLMDVLTDPKLYAEKKEGHGLKVAAAQYQQRRLEGNWSAGWKETQAAIDSASVVGKQEHEDYLALKRQFFTMNAAHLREKLLPESKRNAAKIGKFFAEVRSAEIGSSTAAAGSSNI